MLLIGLLLSICALRTSPVFPQSGDQIVDRPGEYETTPQLYNTYLTRVQDIQVETRVGHLPRLPRYVEGVYNNKIKGPAVRVLWPTPVDNSQVLTPGTYTVTVRIAGIDLNVRVPHWATRGFFVKINGKKEKVRVVPGSYLTLKRKWKDGDRVELRMPFKFYLEPVMDQQNIASLFYGPVLLAAQESGPLEEWRKITLNARDISRYREIPGNCNLLLTVLPSNLFMTPTGVTRFTWM